MKKFFKEHDLVKIIIGMLLFVVLLTWIIPTGGYITEAEFTSGEIQRIGLMHIMYGFVYAVQNFSIQIVFLAFVGIFYGVLSHTDGYKKLVERLAKSGKGKEIVFTICISLIVAFVTSILTNSFVVLLFLPFLIHVLRKMGLNRLSTFATTFGAMLIGILGATYGTDGVNAFVTYLTYGGSEVTITTSLFIRFGILLFAFILFSFFNVMYLKKQLKKKNEEKLEEDKFALGEVKNKKAKVWPIALMMVLLFIFGILGFVDWNTNFGLEIFDEFHEWFMGLSIGEVPIFEAIIGESLDALGTSLATAFGTWYLFTYTLVIAIITVILAFVSKMKSNEFFTYVGEGFKMVLRPIVLLILTYTVFVFIYWSPIVPTIIHFIGGLSDSFNPFVAGLQAIVGSFFNSDLGYLGYSLSYLLGNYTGNEGNVLFVIYTTLYGLVAFITPVSMFLIFGLSYLNIPYKKWIQYIWKFILAMLVALFIIFALLAYL